MIFFDKYSELCEKINADPCSEMMANKLHVTRSAISSWKTKQLIPKPATLILIADLFNVSTDYLLGRESSPEKSIDYPQNTNDFESSSKDDPKGILTNIICPSLIIEKFKKLDDLDQARALSYIDGMLSNDKYYR